MASRLITSLTQALQPKVGEIEIACAKHGVAILVYCTFRDPYEQARHYRKSRTLAQIITKAQQLTDRGYPELSAILINVGPQPGQLGHHITWAGPGESWHQYAGAFDGVPLVEGKCLWSYDKNPEEWGIYGAAIKTAGLFWGGRFGDFPHCSNHKKTNPLDVLSPEEVRQQLKLGGMI